MKHTYTSSSGIQFCWYGDFYIRLGCDTHYVPNYAVIQTSQNVHTQCEFDSLVKYGVLVEIDYQAFYVILSEAIRVIERMAQNQI